MTPVLPVRKDPRACKDLPAHLEPADLQVLLALLARPVCPAHEARPALVEIPAAMEAHYSVF
ncbi:MAG: hypothetical protein BZY77_00710 [SAR202 cluster bacterium Io17-Chloro-G5]|nr:MAG: hypothetical protein BZY77_00710 [SAR202 cluster bacterium Io17-Chloro-G5]